MSTLQARLPRWLNTSVVSAPFAAPASPAAWGSTASEERAFQPSSDESARFVQVVSECARIRRHVDLYRWLSSEVQHFLPHEILLSAWGDFDTWDVKLDLTSGLPGVRTGQLAHCRIDSLVRQAYARWIGAGRQPVLLKAGDIETADHGCHCAIHASLRSMRSVLVHGVHDKRSRQESLFIAFTCSSFTRGRSLEPFVSLLEPLVAQIDAAFRKVPALVLGEGRRGAGDGANVLDLSTRELEVLESMCRGRTNLEIAATLAISPFTVKNHVQRIFRKIGVTNRTQAAARYTEAVRQAALSLAAPKSEAPQQATEAA